MMLLLENQTFWKDFGCDDLEGGPELYRVGLRRCLPTVFCPRRQSKGFK